MKKVLITGGAGFIGFHMARVLANQQQEVTIADNLFRGRKDKELDALIGLENVKFIQCDLTISSELENLERDYDYVYHLAAINGTKYFYEIPDQVLRVNVLSAINILDWFSDTECKKILFSSSSETYAGTMRKFGIEIPTPENVPLCIEDVLNSRWSYGGSKIIGELFFINYSRMKKFDMSIIRYHNIYGPRMGYEHVIPEFTLRLIRKENPFKIFGGEETRAFCYIDDAVYATQMVMENKNTNGGIVHIGNNNEEIKIVDLAKKMFDIVDFQPKLEILEAPKGSVKRRCPNIHKLTKLTKFTPKFSLDEGIKETYNWYKNNRD